MGTNAKEKLNPKKIFNLHSNFWLLPICAGVFFGIGYSITKNLYISKIHSKENLKKFKMNKEFPNPKLPFSRDVHQKLNFMRKNYAAKDKTIKKILYLSSSKDSKIRLEINYSQIQNLKNQAAFKNNHNFFAKETVQSLMKTLNNTKKLNLLK